MIKKNIWILNIREQDIQSVHQISENLCNLYRHLPEDKYEILEINLSDSSCKNLLIDFKKNTPDHVAIVHPGVVRHVFLGSLLCLKTKTSPQYIFHVYGNFVRYGEIWFSLNHLLTNKKIQFIVASKCYYDLLLNFISERNLYQMPFPISLTKEKTITSGNQSQTEIIKLLYAGRYHEQKNVTALIKILNEISQALEKKIELTLAVYFDDFNPTTLETKKILGEQFSDYSEEIMLLSDYFHVRLLPHQNNASLNELYSNNDALISFSTFFDEDYGNIVIESLASGTPCIVSNWGGYKDFCQEFPDDCFGLDINLEENNFYINTEKLSSFILKTAVRNIEQREKLKQKAGKYIGLPHLHHKLNFLFSKGSTFSGFEQSLLTFSRKLKNPEEENTLIDFEKYYYSFWQIQ